MANNNYYGFTHNATPYAAASAASGYQASQAAYGVSSAPGVTATSSYSAPRNAGYDTSAYQAATSASYGVTATTPASYDYAAASYGRGSGNVGVTFETNKSYYQQATVGQTSSQSTGVGPHVAVPSANTVVSTVVSSDLQNWQGQNFGNRQTSGAPGAGKSVYNTSANYPVPVTRVPTKVQQTPQPSYITPQYQQQSPTTIQSVGSVVPNVGTIGQSKKIYSQPVGSAPTSGFNPSPGTSVGVGSAAAAASQISGAAIGYSAQPATTYGSVYPVSTIHNVASSAPKTKVNPVNTSAAGPTPYSAPTPYDSALLNAAFFMNQNSNPRAKYNPSYPNYKLRPGLGSTAPSTATAATAARPYRPRIPPKPQQLHYCDACKVSCAGPGAYHDHLQGQKHKKKVAKKKAESAKSQGGLPIFVCKLCDVECTAADAYAAHLRGAKHTKVAKLHMKLGKPIPPVDPKAAAAIAALNLQEESNAIVNVIANANASATVNKIAVTTSSVSNGAGSSGVGSNNAGQVGPSRSSNSNKTSSNVETSVDSSAVDGQETIDPNEALEAFKDDRPAVGMEYIDEEKNEVGKLINFVCKLCDCKFSDPNAKEMHMKGRKHRLAFKKKVDPELKVEIRSNTQQRRNFVKNRSGKKRTRGEKKCDISGSEHDDGSTDEAIQLKLQSKEEWSKRGSSGPRARMLAEENAQNSRLWEQEYRRYEEELKEYRQYCRKYGGSGMPPPVAMPGMLARDIGFPLMRAAGPPRTVIPVMPPVRIHPPPNPPKPPPFMVGPNQPNFRESVEDRHITYRHKAICQNESELRHVNQIIASIEKSVRAVSDVMMSSEEGQESVCDASIKSEDKETDDKETNKAVSSRVLIGLHRVGSLAKTLMLNGNTTVELVLMCTVKPTLTLLNDVVSHLPPQLKKSDEFTFKVIPDPSNAAIKIIVTSNKDEHVPAITIIMTITSPVVREEILTTNNADGSKTVLAEITPDPVDVLDKTKCLEALAAVRHAKWFQARAFGLHNCLLIIRILKDLCERVPTWAPFNCWLMELLVERVISSSAAPLSPGDALRRVFEAISCGVLLPDGPGIQDPCEKDPIDAASMIKPQEREDITASAQHALRMMAFNQIHKILGMEKLPVQNKFKSGIGRDFSNRKRRRENSAGGGKNEDQASSTKPARGTVVDGKKDKKENLDVNVQAAAESTAEDNSVVVKMDISDTTIDN